MAKRTSDVTEDIKTRAQEVYDKIRRRRKPQMRLSIRALSNVKYRPRAGYFQLNGRNKIRTLSVNTVKTFAQTLKMLAMSKDLVRTGRHSTKREAYYQAYNWNEAAFSAQEESFLP